MGGYGSMLITTSYFLTAAISAVSGFQYIGSVFPAIDEHIVLLACTALSTLAILNVIGIRESAAMALVMATAALVVDVVVIGFTFRVMSPADWWRALETLTPAKEMSSRDVMVGFGAAWLAFSGLESISQLSPTMRFPLRRTTRWAMAAVVVTMLLTAPILTTFSITLLSPRSRRPRVSASSPSWGRWREVWASSWRWFSRLLPC